MNAGIKDNLEKQNISISDLNTQLRTLLELALSNTGSSTRVAANDLDNETLALMSNQCLTPVAVILRETELDDVLCPLCRFPEAGDTIQCDICIQCFQCSVIRLSVYIKYREQSESVDLLKSNIQVRNNKQEKSANSGETASGTQTEEHMAPDHVRGQYIQPWSCAATNHRAAFLKPPRVAPGISHSDDVSLPAARCTRVSIRMSLIRFPRETAAAVSHNAPTALNTAEKMALVPCQPVLS